MWWCLHIHAKKPSTNANMVINTISNNESRRWYNEGKRVLGKKSVGERGKLCPSEPVCPSEHQGWFKQGSKNQGWFLDSWETERHLSFNVQLVSAASGRVGGELSSSTNANNSGSLVNFYHSASSDIETFRFWCLWTQRKENDPISAYQKQHIRSYQ